MQNTAKTQKVFLSCIFWLMRRMMMPRYKVRIDYEVEVEAEDSDDAENIAAGIFNYADADFETEEIDDD